MENGETSDQNQKSWDDKYDSDDWVLSNFWESVVVML
jgi:hypothetical protein